MKLMYALTFQPLVPVLLVYEYIVYLRFSTTANIWKFSMTNSCEVPFAQAERYNRMRPVGVTGLASRVVLFFRSTLWQWTNI